MVIPFMISVRTDEVAIALGVGRDGGGDTLQAPENVELAAAVVGAGEVHIRGKTADRAGFRPLRQMLAAVNVRTPFHVHC